MFTGIIQHLGRVERLNNHSLAVKVRGLRLKNGDSIAVDGACLTVSKTKAGTLEFDLSEETLSKTTLGRLKKGDLVNLEASLTLSSLVGGHLVTGHIEGVGQIKKLQTQRHSVQAWFTAPKNLLKYLVPKGSVAIQGVSLTVVGAGRDSFSVSLIPYTVEHTNLGSKKEGDRVNIETDLLAKYIERLMDHRS